MRSTYRYSLSVTSQFPFCGLPLRLDTYSVCQFACRYCFASARGGVEVSNGLQVADISVFRRRLAKVRAGNGNTAIDGLLAKRVPIHMGGMSDPFMPLEQRLGVSREHLEAAIEFDQPVVISTKSARVCDDDVVEILRRGRFAVQISLGTTDDAFGRLVDRGADPPSVRLASMARLSEAGVSVSCRIQPVFPGRESEVIDLIGSVVARKLIQS